MSVEELLRQVLVEIEASRLARINGAWLEPPIDPVDVACIDLLDAASQLRSLSEIGAFELLIRSAEAHVQESFESLVALRARGVDSLRWQPFAELMTGTPPGPGAEPPSPLFANTWVEDVTVPRDARVLRDGFLVMFPLVSVVIGADGEVRDWFPTCGLRPVGDDGTSILFVCGGGPAAKSGYFTPKAIVRDLVHRRWNIGPVPASLPRFVAGTIGDMKWAIVADLEQSRGYRMSPRLMGDQCGGTCNSAGGHLAFDGGNFVVDAATGRPVFDARKLKNNEVLSFDQRADGSFRFIVAPFDEEGDPLGVLVVADGRGATLRDIPEGAAAVLAPGGESLLLCSSTELQLIDLDSGEQRCRIDLRQLAPALALPDDTELWRDMLAAHGVAEPVARETPAALRAARVEVTFCEDDSTTDEEYDQLIERARTHPKLSQIRRLG